VVFDEFHERHLATISVWRCALDVQAGVREDLRLLVMSATLDGARLASYMAWRHASKVRRAQRIRSRSATCRAGARSASRFSVKRAAWSQALDEERGRHTRLFPAGPAEIDDAGKALGRGCCPDIDLGRACTASSAIEAQARGDDALRPRGASCWRPMSPSRA
jgi:ATP-dependent helicase HrpB